MAFLQIENKEDSAVKVQQMAGKPTKNYLKAEEFNKTIDAINNLNARVSETSDKLTVDAGFEIDGLNFQLNEGNKWEISGSEKIAVEHIIKAITLSEHGMIRQCIVLLNSENDFYFKYGQPHPTSPPKPTKDTETVELTVFPVTDSEVGTPEVPVVNGDYITKSSRRDAFLGFTGDNVLLPEPSERVGFRLIAAGLNSIDGILYGGAFGSNITVGDLFPITNVTGNSVTLNHSSYFITDNYVLLNERVVLVRYEGNGIYRLVGVNQNQSKPQKTVTGNITADNSWNGAIIKVKASAVITIPSGLVKGFEFDCATFTGATATLVQGAGVTLNSPNGLILQEKKMLTVFNDTLNTYEVRGEQTTS